MILIFLILLHDTNIPNAFENISWFSLEGKGISILSRKILVSQWEMLQKCNSVIYDTNQSLPGTLSKPLNFMQIRTLKWCFYYCDSKYLLFYLFCLLFTFIIFINIARRRTCPTQFIPSIFPTARILWGELGWENDWPKTT